ncbi:MAG: hypothetical protein CMJ26_01200 [Phycisphaerae bacterium]|nr:hypothetical protein [Phycisphaerae bacterium]
MIFMKFMLSTLLISMFLSSAALADTLTVNNDGKADSNTIQEALNATSDGEIFSGPTSGFLTGESGACCYQSDAEYLCQDIPGPEGQNLCGQIFQGVWQGAGSYCLSTDCYSGLTGACCIEDFKYYCEEEVTQEECEWNWGGTFLGTDSTCTVEGDYCQSDIGACCIDFYDCYDSTTDNECYWMGGDFYGDGTTCSQDAPNCTTYYGACCFGDYCVNNVEEYACEVNGGYSFWAFSSCDELTDVEECVDQVLLGACCVENALCYSDFDELQCFDYNGEWFGPDSSCEIIDCIDPNGACCYENDCQILYQWECDNQDGFFYEEQECDICSPECLLDLNQDEHVNIGDLLNIIADWGLTESPADVTGDGVVNVSDLLLIISNWGPCE